MLTLSYINTALSQSAFRVYKCYILIYDGSALAGVKKILYGGSALAEVYVSIETQEKSFLYTLLNNLLITQK